MRTNEENLDLFADLLEPVAEILADKKIAESLKNGEAPIKAVKMAIKGHKQAVITVLALSEGKDPADYEVGSPLVLGGKLLKLLNMPEVQELFISQGQKTAAASFGSATEISEGEA